MAISIFHRCQKTVETALFWSDLLPGIATRHFSGSKEGMKGLYAKRGWWYYQAPTPKDAPRPKPVALKTQDEITAINAVTNMQWNGMILAAETKDILAKVLPRYYAAKASHTKKTRHGREQILDAFMNRIGNPRVTDITKKTIIEWREKLATTGGTAKSTRPVSTTTMTSYLIVVRAFFTWCVEERIIRLNPTLKMGKESTVRETRRQEFHTIEERDKILARPAKDYVGLINHLGFFAGLRDGEMLVINPDWIYIAPDKTHGSIKVQPTMIELTDGSKILWEPKTKRGTRTIPMHERLIKFLDNYGMRKPYLLKPDQPLFPPDNKKSLRFDPKNSLKNHAKLCDVPKTGYHKLRHSFGTHLAMGGKTMAGIAGLLGITVKVAEDSYAGYSPGIKDQLPGV